jgi:hypothetical protein
MNERELTNLIDSLISNWEDEVVEFKQATQNYSTSENQKDHNYLDLTNL